MRYRGRVKTQLSVMESVPYRGSVGSLFETINLRVIG
jgi:hypothetical protein